METGKYLVVRRLGGGISDLVSRHDTLRAAELQLRKLGREFQRGDGRGRITAPYQVWEETPDGLRDPYTTPINWEEIWARIY